MLPLILGMGLLFCMWVANQAPEGLSVGKAITLIGVFICVWVVIKLHRWETKKSIQEPKVRKDVLVDRMLKNAEDAKRKREFDYAQARRIEEAQEKRKQRQEALQGASGRRGPHTEGARGCREVGRGGIVCRSVTATNTDDNETWDPCP